ncbi:response regulator [Bacillus sp. FSL M8-0266]|uniref:response regulator n=1 Tax=Bacillus TaxID=1386 RepID=UPI0007EEE538|nr:response regulator [Bacillus pumilus]MBU8574091.1 response regulator [Bacillus pumilus]MBU8608477.1 response regulator [Bacillus pumilus]MCW4682403.1 response regulator [Bacillus pumilus]MDX5484748.1 response regulator [Bacillus pumilus]MED1108634.1 response regulator [Bacillus pumilus]
MLNVLIVDDEKIERLAMRKFMTDWLPECHIAGEAENGKKAVEFVRTEPVHLVLMDIQMPGMDGLIAIKQIKAISPHTKFIMLTAYDTFDYAKQAMQEGVKQYLVKPADKDETITAIRTVAAEIQQEASQRQAVAAGQQSKWLEAHVINGQSYTSTEFQQLFHEFEAGLVIAVQRTIGDQLLMDLQTSPLFHTVPIQVSGELFTCLIYRHQAPGHLKADVLQAIRTATTNDQPLPVVGIGHPVSNPLYLQKSAAEAKLAYYQRKKSPGVVRYGFYQTEEQSHPLIHLPELADDMMQAMEEGRREDALALFDAFELEGATLSQLKELLILFKSRLRTDWPILTISTAVECRQCCEYLFDVYEARNQTVNDIERAKRYIKTHFCEQITLEQTAAYVDLSPTYFTKRFKDETGLTFKEYVTTCRLDKIKQLLKDSSLSLKEITYQAGYTDPNYVSRVFKKMVGCSPKEYRKQTVKK